MDAITRRLVIGLAALAVLLGTVSAVGAHCDALDGPVVKAARLAFQNAEITPALRWVEPARERELRSAFDQALAVRALGADAGQLAERWFFETLVRLHREGEGAPFTGLKPAGGELPPGVAEADHAVETGAADALIALTTERVAHGVRERFQHVMAARAKADTSVPAGREFVHAYTEFVHYLEAVHLAAQGGDAHGPEK